MPAATPSTPSSSRPSTASSTGGQKLAGLLIFLTDVHSIGLKTAQGLNLTSAWYWDHDRREPQAFTKDFAAANGGRRTRPWCRPASIRACTHYLKAVAKL